MSKILFITNTANKIGAFSIADIRAAQKSNIDFHMAAYWNCSKEEMDKLEKDFDVRLHHVDLERSPYSFKNYRALKQIQKIIRDEDIDYIHCNTPVGGILGRLAGKMCKAKKIIYQVHGFHFYKGSPGKNWLMYYPVEKLLAYFTDALITINKEDYGFAKTKLRLHNGGKVYYVPGVGIDTAQYNVPEETREAKRAELGIPSDAFVLISVGELNANKNNKVIISAMGKVNRKDIHYVLCGVGEQELALRKQAELAGLKDNIHFLGYRNDVKELYKMADCFVMPSFREGLSRSIMEAMASGLPCIVSKIRGNEDLIENDKGGFLCDATDEDAFAEKIKVVSSHSNICEEMRKNNLLAIKNFDVETVTAEICKIYEAVFR